MKTNRFLIFALLLLALVACTREEQPENQIASGVITGLTEDVYFEQVGQIDSIGLVEHYELLIQQTTENNADDTAFLTYLQEQLAAAEEYQEDCINQSGANWDTGEDGEGGKNRLLGYQYASIRYKSINEKGEPVMLSTLVVWPYNNILSNPDPNNVVIGCHITITKNSERPTNYSKNSIKTDVGMLACAAKSNGLTSAYENLVIIPDYQGYGATYDEVHPYLCQDLTARQVLDGVRAGIKYYEDKQGKLEKDWRSLSMGYSQGGSVAMAVQRYVEQNDLNEEFRFAGAVCGDGPYDPIATVKTYITTGEVYMPVAVALIMKGMCDTDPKLAGKYTPADFLTQKFLDTKIIDMINAKDKSTDDIGQVLLDYSLKYNTSDSTTLCMYRKADKGQFFPYRKDTQGTHSWASGQMSSYAKTSDLLRPEIIEWFNGNGPAESKDKFEALSSALKGNVLHHGWAPQHPIFIVHSQGDEVVPIQNYDACLNAWKGSSKVKGIRYKGVTQSHVNFGSYYYMIHAGMATVAIFSNTTDVHFFDRTDVGI